ncbi:MAG: ribonuclease HI [Bdellovibrio sp.]|nr:ribonuclease HI [Bdellovibrio sp.]
MLWLQKFFQKPLDVYTDGSLKFGRGSWAFVVVDRNKTVLEKFGTAKKTTCNRMEFQAVIEVLRVLPRNRVLKIHTDSRVLLEALANIPAWKEQGWVKKNSAPIPSVDQMILLEQLLHARHVKWQWVKAHSGIPFNERCDELCFLARKGPTD